MNRKGLDRKQCASGRKSGNLWTRNTLITLDVHFTERSEPTDYHHDAETRGGRQSLDSNRCSSLSIVKKNDRQHNNGNKYNGIEGG